MLTSFFRGALVKKFNKLPNLQVLRHQTTVEVEQPFTSPNQNETSESSSIQGTADQENMNIQAKCEPTEKLAEMIKENKAIEEKVKRIQKEFEVFIIFVLF